MKTLLQRCTYACVNSHSIGTRKINHGLVVFVGFKKGDGKEQIAWMTRKIENLHIFNNRLDEKMYSIIQVKGSLLVISQFTLYGTVSKGKTPSFTYVAPYKEAEKLYNMFIDQLKETKIPIVTGVFGAEMMIELSNDGPYTLILEK